MEIPIRITVVYYTENEIATKLNHLVYSLLLTGFYINHICVHTGWNIPTNLLRRFLNIVCTVYKDQAIIHFSCPWFNKISDLIKDMGIFMTRLCIVLFTCHLMQALRTRFDNSYIQHIWKLQVINLICNILYSLMPVAYLYTQTYWIPSCLL